MTRVGGGNGRGTEFGELWTRVMWPCPGSDVVQRHGVSELGVGGETRYVGSGQFTEAFECSSEDS